MDAWQIYMGEFRRRGERAAAQPFERNAALAEAAHEAYQATADQLTGLHGWGDDRALAVLRGFNAAVQEWSRRDDADWQVLQDELIRRETVMQNGFGG